jgi:hypothetical protein
MTPWSMAKAAAFSRSAIQRKATSARAVPCATTTLSRRSVACQAHAHQQIGIAFAPRRDKVPLALLARRKRIAFVRQQLGIGDVLPAPECELRQPRVGAIAQGSRARPSVLDTKSRAPASRPIARQQLAEDLAAVNRLGPTERGQLGIVLPCSRPSQLHTVSPCRT